MLVVAGVGRPIADLRRSPQLVCVPGDRATACDRIDRVFLQPARVGAGLTPRLVSPIGKRAQSSTPVKVSD